MFCDSYPSEKVQVHIYEHEYHLEGIIGLHYLSVKVLRDGIGGKLREVERFLHDIVHIREPISSDSATEQVLYSAVLATSPKDKFNLKWPCPSAVYY